MESFTVEVSDLLLPHTTYSVEEEGGVWTKRTERGVFIDISKKHLFLF